MKRDTARTSRSKRAGATTKNVAQKPELAKRDDDRGSRTASHKKTSRKSKPEKSHSKTRQETASDIDVKLPPPSKQKSNARFTFVVMFYILAIATVGYMIFAEKRIAASYVDAEGSVEGRTIVTGADRVELSSKEGHMLTIHPFSEVEFSKLGHHSTLVMKKGLIDVVIVDRLVSPKITVKLPQSVVSGRGASFVVGCVEGYDYARVQAGNISFKSGEESLKLSLRQEVVVVRGELREGDLVKASRYDFEKSRLLESEEKIYDLDLSKRKDFHVKNEGRFTKKSANFKGGSGLELDSFDKINSKNLTLSCWILPSAGGDGYNYIAGQSDFSKDESGGWQFVLNPDDKLSFMWCKERRNSGDDLEWAWEEINGVTVRKDQWMHLLAVIEEVKGEVELVEPVKVTFYINGKFVGSKESSLINPLSGNKLLFGRLSPSSSEQVKAVLFDDFIGRIDEFMIVSGALGSDKIETLYKLGMP